MKYVIDTIDNRGNYLTGLANVREMFREKYGGKEEQA